jgi:hypothetical protein
MSSHLPVDTAIQTATQRSRALPTGLLAYALTSCVVILGMLFSYQFVAPPPYPEGAPRSSWSSRADGGWYARIATEGYDYDPNMRSSVAFFPLFPLLGAGVIRLTGLEPTWALLVVSHICLAAAFAVAAVYLHSRWPTSDRTKASLTLLALGLMPATLFFRITYSESTFLMLSLLFMLGIQRGWPLLVVALIAGLASASRPVGIGLLPPLLLYAWRSCPSRRAFLIRATPAILIGCWGLLAYAAFLYARFGEPLAFAQTQVHWGKPAPSLAAKTVSLLSYEPIWKIFLRGPIVGWSVFTWERVNPVYFVASAALVAFGALRRWLSAYEASLAAALLLIPYLTRAYEMDMASSARFASVVFPAYLVLGEVLARLPLIVSTGLLAISAFFLAAFSAMFASGYRIF